MISLANLNATSSPEFAAALGGIYEHSDWVPEAVSGLRPFKDPEALRLAMRRAVDAADESLKLALIRAHPDLAGKLARAGELTKESRSEQAGLGLDQLSDGEFELFSDRNQRYREKFGFPFIICARLTTKQGVLDAFEIRLQNSREAETQEAVLQIHEIAKLRLKDLVVA